MIESGNYNCFEFYCAATEQYGDFDTVQHMDKRVKRSEFIREVKALSAYFYHELGLRRGDV